MSENRKHNTTAEVLMDDEPPQPQELAAPILAAAAAEYSNELDLRYGGVAGDMVTYGSNFGFPLGIPELLQADDDVYPPRRVVTGIVEQGATVCQFACGDGHTVVLLDNGHAMTWGCNDYGTLGRPTEDVEEPEESQATPTLITGFYDVNGHKEDGEMIQVAAGDSQTHFLSKKGNVYSTGFYMDFASNKFHDLRYSLDNPKGSLSIPYHVLMLPQNVIRIYAGGAFNAALLSDHSLVTWGFGRYGELARNADMVSPNAEGKCDLKTLRVKSNGTLDYDFIREQFLRPAPVRFGGVGSLKKTVLFVACGSNHLLVVAREPDQLHSTLYSSGLNVNGQLGHGDTDDCHELTPVTALKDINVGQVAAGASHSLCLNETASQLYSWGRGNYGQLGHGATEQVAGQYASIISTPTLVKFPVPESPKVLLFKDIACGSNTSMALTTDHDLYTWGDEGTTGHQEYDNKDLCRPKKLDVEKILKENGDTDSNDSKVVVCKIGSGSKHSALLVKRYATNNSS